MADYSKLPASVKIDLKPFKAHVDDQKLQDFKTLLKLSPVAPPNFENSDKSVDRRYGTSRDWLLNAKDHWLNKFDWRKIEDRINSTAPNFTAKVKDDAGHDLEIHFLALFSQKKDAQPLVLYHGWPGSFLEFLQILDLLKEKYTPQDLPYHVIVPSIPGYAYSSGPPVDFDFSLENASHALNNLLLGLGFENYIAQGGDLGSFISRYSAANFDSCKGMHLNFSPTAQPKNAESLEVTETEGKAMQRGLWFRQVGMAYSLEHGTRTATIGHCLSASPLALLSWIGEKFLEWTDEDPPLDEILASVTLYWMTDTFPRCIYPYRGLNGGEERPRIANISGGRRDHPYVKKPSGYSLFPKELVPMPKSWVAQTCELVSAKEHTSGGHFAALEKPKELLEDIEEYIQKAFKA